MTEPSTPTDSGGIWVDRASISAAATAGPAWEQLLERASGDCESVDLSESRMATKVCVMAKALVFARTSDPACLDDVWAALLTFATTDFAGSAWLLGREVPAYVIAADLISLQQYDPELDGVFTRQLQRLLTTPTSPGPSDLVTCHEERPNNWGTHCGAARVAIAAYRNDRAELDRIASVFKGYVGDRSSYSGFDFGDLSWQCDPTAPVGINPAGCARDGFPLDGVLPDDQRRGGGFTWPPPREGYVWEALQGAVVQAAILHRAGFPAFEWQDRALLRAAEWLYRQAAFPPSGDDEWQPYVINYFYGTDLPAPMPARPGKNVAWTDWTHAADLASR